VNAPMKLRVRVRAPLKDVHHALTDAGALRTWLAEYAEVDLPHRYQFWGRYTPDGAEPRQELHHADERTLRFSWKVGGEDSDVEISLAEEGPDATIVTVSQTNVPDAAEAMAETSIRSTLHSYWSLTLANLVDHVEGRELNPMCDFTSPEMRAEVVVDAPREAVYDSLMDPAKFSRWMGAKIEIEPRVGGRWAMGGFELDPDPARILELEPDRKLSFGWSDGTTAGWELADSDGKTRLTFVQSGFDTGKPPYGAWMGWISGVAELRRFLEVPDWRPIWVEIDVPGMPEGMLTTE
jgi:uncharacterized protein YndB with AHSA1/START domain